MRITGLQNVDFESSGSADDSRTVAIRRGQTIDVDDDLAGTIIGHGYAEMASAMPDPAPVHTGQETAPVEDEDEGLADEPDEDTEDEFDEILAGNVKDIAAEIERGDHDDYLPELADVEGARSRPRKSVLEAISERLASLS